MLTWFEENPDRYWWSVCLVLAFVGFAVVRPLLQKQAPAEHKRSDWRWGLVIFGVLVAGRWPSMLMPREYNPDESVLLAAMITYRHDPVPWRSVDTFTSGPLNPLALGPVGTIRGHDDYLTARITALLLLAAAICFAHQTITSVFGASVARASTLPVLMMEAITLHPDFLHYSTELLSVCLLAACFWAIWRQIFQPTTSFFSALIGTLLGAAPFAKPQAAPIALVMGVTYAVLEIIRWVRGHANARRRALAAATGAILPTVVIALIVWLTGQWHDAVASYLQYNLNYVKGGVGPLRLMREFSEFLSIPGGLLVAWFFGTLLACLVGLSLAFPARGPQRIFLIATAAFLLLSLACVLTPLRPLPHYLQLIVVPATLLLGAGLGSAAQKKLFPRWTLFSRWFAAAFLLPGVVLFWFRAPVPHPVVQRLGFYRTMPEDPVVQVVHHFTVASDSLCVWGWRNRYYPETARRQATRDALSAAQILPGPNQAYYRERYLRDLQQSQPAAFIDASIAPEFGFTHSDLAPEIRFPLLGEWLNKNYTLVANLNSTRIFIRNDRVRR